MTKEEAVEQGYLEAYLLGELESEKIEALEALLSRDLDLRNKLDTLEADFEKMAMDNAIEPPAHIKENLKKALEQPKVRLPYRPDLWAAASLALLFAITAFSLFLRWQSTQEELELLQEDNLFVRSELEEIRSKNLEQEVILERVASPEVVPVFLRGNQRLTSFKIVAYLDEASGQVWINTADIPSPPEGRSYQMWGDVDDHMVSMGIVKPQGDWQAMTYLPEASSLNVTLEPEGGSEEASVDQLLAQTIIP